MDTLVDAIVASLRDRPLDWEYSGFSLYNAQRKTRIWVANGRSFLDVTVDDETVLGSTFALIPLASWRWRIWSAAKGVMRRGSAIDRRLCAAVNKHWFSNI